MYFFTACLLKYIKFLRSSTNKRLIENFVFKDKWMFECLLKHLNSKNFFQAEPALMFDSVYVFAKGLAAMETGHSLKPVNLSCDLENAWSDGLTLYNYIDSVVSF